MSEATMFIEFLAGTPIKAAIEEAKQKAKKLDLAYVKFNFNGANFSIGSDADVSAVVEEWKKTRGKPYGIVAA